MYSFNEYFVYNNCVGILVEGVEVVVVVELMMLVMKGMFVMLWIKGWNGWVMYFFE